ncbi:Porin subfamily protein [Allopseudospirillum japonicum]|uniref:Porin subfamily protein n=1 Tax=Allopseudospirillum japonicum TaxID=64971 RepID=A0A1H6QUM6_9GAMM|nr:porin [Allopseudospirillum japonicum]SEI45746.1 Porin subfamily protein [Allopseudospirillum japonicum]
MKLAHKIAGTVILPLAAVAMASSAHAASWKIDSLNTEVGIGGYVKLEARSIDKESGADDFLMHAKQTRFNLSTKTATSYGDIKTFIEMDFYGNQEGTDSNSKLNPRMRHAAVMWDGWLAGQYWSTFSTFEGMAETLDFVGVTGKSVHLERNAQLAKTLNFGQAGKLTLGIEDRNQSGDSTSPDPAIKYANAFGPLAFSLAAQNYEKADDTKTRVGAGAKLSLGSATLQAGYTDDEDNYDAVSGAIKVKFNDSLRANLVYENVDFETGTDYDQAWANLIYKTGYGVEVGGEYSVKMYDDAIDSKDHIVQVDVKYAF